MEGPEKQGGPLDEQLLTRIKKGERRTFDEIHAQGLRYADEGTFNRRCVEDDSIIGPGR